MQFLRCAATLPRSKLLTNASENTRKASEAVGEKLNLPVYFPSKHLSTDNAAMIAAAGYFHLQRGERSDLRMTADVSMRLQKFENEDGELKKMKVRYRL